MSKGFMIAIAVVAVLVVGGLIYWYMAPNLSSSAPASGGASPAAPAAGAPAPGPFGY